MKKCSTCFEEKPVGMFSVRKQTRDGLSGQCRECIRKKSNEYKEAHKERLSAYRSDYYSNNSEKIKNTHAKYYEKNRDRLIEYSSKWRAENPEKLIEYRKEYYEKNKDAILLSGKIRYARSDKSKEKARRKEYYRDNRDSEHKYSNEYQKNRRKVDPVFALICSIRSRICGVLSNFGVKKDGKVSDILGCSFKELHRHIESKFYDGMGWHNRSEWHIDHIMPLASAKSEEDVLRLNHYTNLQPLWAGDNLRKGASITDYAGGSLSSSA